jgi:hypothetical protein
MSHFDDLTAACEAQALVDAHGGAALLFEIFLRRKDPAAIARGQALVDAALVRGLDELGAMLRPTMAARRSAE